MNCLHNQILKHLNFFIQAKQELHFQLFAPYMTTLLEILKNSCLNYIFFNTIIPQDKWLNFGDGNLEFRPLISMFDVLIF